MLISVEIPDSAEAAQAGLQRGAVPLGGGTHLLTRTNDEAGPGLRLVSLRKAGLRGIDVAGATVTMGAATTLADVEDDPRLGRLHPCVRSIASPPVRNLATVAGNLFVPQPYGDLAAALLALDAELDVLGPGGARREPLERVVKDGLPTGELVTGIRFTAPADGTFRFYKASRRRLNSGAIVTVAARITVEDGLVADVRLVLGGLARRLVRAAGAERVLLGAPLTAGTVARAAVADAIEPFDDAYASAWYRARVYPVHLRRALLGA
ncbi:FAD binding domain-containing protein [Nonomuraea gerenzanensis]|uniref:Xanthine dehydrogenase iron-sulfur subunit / Xanthine dehydrogenase, FAD binding subunit n=1 Tax=Nonomuraea gerenzanensis TaxID=93944 RepID=A0A1M4EIB4_9ACTN|nr:FAD binding domain-containing protein [Nonomuraea gerenzanensis]UBU10273.1 FAD binding domain-containing protein [Nonomuraea gerenzanensis]SBO98655.1 Xanthine dehydrogenase iron-sulfur subunit / Xanthine dehydrogenase, FAD binding subunit [Nonomuraea gerenzanensis]